MDRTIADVLDANRAFYDAHEARDLDAMVAVWEHSDRVVCVHPGWPILRTWSAVHESWRHILGGPGRNQFILTNEAVAIDGDLAWVTLDENLVDRGGTGTVAATNLYARTAGRWLLVVHHGSPVMGR
jgi:ketosteroid isomerase-like protein